MVLIHAERLKAFRKEMSERLSINHYQMSKYERGVENPSLETLAAMARVFNTTTDYPLGLTDVREPPAWELSPGEVEVVTLLRRRAPTERRRLIDALKVLYGEPAS